MVLRVRLAYPPVNVDHVAGLMVPLLLLALQNAATGNPSDQDPHAAMAVHNLAGSKEIVDQASGVSAKALQDMQGIIASQGKASAKQLADVHVAVRRLERLAQDLEIHGETAGTDYSLRADILLEQLRKALQAFTSNPANGSQIAKIRQTFFAPRQQQKFNLAIQNVQKFQREEKWLEAHSLLEETYDEVTSYTVFLSAQEGEQYLATYGRMRQEIMPRRNTLLRQQVQAKLEEVGTPIVPDTQGLLDAVAAAATSLQSGPTASVAGQACNGPQCMDQFLRQWQGIHLNAVRCRAVDWARRVPVRTVAVVTPRANRVDDALYAAFCEQLIQGLASIVAADAQRISATEASQLYAQYLQVLGPPLSRMSDDRLETALMLALNQLVAKAPELNEQVTAYRAATDELLRWRERVASEEAAARDTQFPASQTVLEQAFAARENYRGLLAAVEPTLAEAKLQGSCPEALIGAGNQVVQRSVRIGRTAALPGGTAAVAAYGDRHYATLPMPQVAQAADLLGRDLFVTEQTPPLSLPAAVAVASAREGQFEAVGGTIEHVFVEGLIPRFAVLPPAAFSMLRLGPLPTEPNERLLLPHVLLRLQLTPAWVNHRYFFAQVPPPASTGGAE